MDGRTPCADRDYFADRHGNDVGHDEFVGALQVSSGEEAAMPSRDERPKQRDYAPKYSGRLSARFWKRVNAIPYEQEGKVIYNLGCALQDLESRVVTALTNAERKKLR